MLADRPRGRARACWLREGLRPYAGDVRRRFANAANFRGEPFLPGNDLLARYPSPRMTGGRLAAAAEALVGAPFRLHGRDPAIGLDCVGVVVAALAASAGAVDAPRGYALRNRSIADLLELRCRYGLVDAREADSAGRHTPGPARTRPASPADRGRTDRFIHAHAGLRRVVAQPGPLPLADRAPLAARTRGILTMATLLFTAVGHRCSAGRSAARSARCVGRSVDGAIIGGGKREGPRLQGAGGHHFELRPADPAPSRPHARAGTIIWATDLVEHKDKSGGKKGQPSATTYAYTDFVRGGAVEPADRAASAASGPTATCCAARRAISRPPARCASTPGDGDQAPDPLIAAAKGVACPALPRIAPTSCSRISRSSDFGNRIPALTFEVMADEGAIALADLIDPLGADAAVRVPRSARWPGSPTRAGRSRRPSTRSIRCFR